VNRLRFLILADTFSVDGTSPWLLEDLAAALVRAGHEVDVIVKDLVTPRPLGEQPGPVPGVTVFSVGVTRPPTSVLDRRARLPRAMWGLRRAAAAWCRGRRYDAVLYTSLSWTKAGFPGHLVRTGVADVAVLVHWDFFPVHQREIGHFERLPQQADPFLRAVEARAATQADVVAVMTPRNLEFFESYFGSSEASFVIVPPWGSDQAPRGTHPPVRPRSPFTAVFGGQIAAGRGLEELVEAAALVEATGTPIRWRIFGQGPKSNWLAGQVVDRKLASVAIEGQIPRHEYAEVLSRSHCGIVATVSGVSVPTFPSKLVDYCSASLPVIVASESSGDVGSWVNERRIGLAVEAGDPVALADAVTHMEALWRNGALWEEMSRASRCAYESELSADVAAGRIAAAVATRLGQGSPV
jgi:glycosyltransferase involved in cell wall biosynthesis